MISNLGNHVKKERCPECQKFISTHHKILVCHHCSFVCHAKCSQNFQIDTNINKPLCHQCALEKPKVYNPFESILHYDKHDPNNLDEVMI